jgi:hypothetical protein
MARYKVEFEAEAHANQDGVADNHIRLVVFKNGVHTAIVVPKAIATSLRPEPKYGEVWKARNAKNGWIAESGSGTPIIIYPDGGWDPVSFATERLWPEPWSPID